MQQRKEVEELETQHTKYSKLDLQYYKNKKMQYRINIA
jgi:hypothetical protein